MQYKTTIEVVTDGDSEHEAADIAGEFLKGEIATGADLKVKTISAMKAKRIKVIWAICVGSAVLSTLLISNKIVYKMAKIENKPVTSYAIQPPLKTNLTNIQNNKEFKEIWEKEQDKRINSMAR